MRRPELNIQLFALGGDNGNVELTPGEQTRYGDTIREALGQTDSYPLAEYMAKQNTDSRKDAIFYVAGSIVARDVLDNYDATNKNYKDVKGTDVAGFLKAIAVATSPMECPVWVGRRAFSKSQLNEKGAISNAQIDAIYMACDKRISTLMKDIVTNKKRSVKDEKGASFDLTVPDKNFYGDKLKVFSDPANLKAFRLMMLKAKKLAKKSKLKVAIVTGDEGEAELQSAKEFATKDWGAMADKMQMSGEISNRLLGANTESTFTFDDVFYSAGTEAVGYMVVMVEGTLGQANKGGGIDSVVKYITHKKSYFMDVEVDNATELVDPTGFLVFAYKR